MREDNEICKSFVLRAFCPADAKSDGGHSAAIAFLDPDDQPRPDKLVYGLPRRVM
jgi:hypothetical protein